MSQMSQVSAPTRPNTVERAPARRQEFLSSDHLGHWRGMARWAVAAALIASLGALVAACGGAPPSRAVSIPPPELFGWAEQATRTAQSPQAAYAAAMRLTPCLGAPGASPYMGDPPRSSAVTWLVTTPNYGLADIQIACVPPAQPYHLFLLQLYRNAATGGWKPRGGILVGKNGNAPYPGSAPPPAWLPLPDDAYVRSDVEQPGLQESPEAGVVAWDGQTHLFVLGHIADRAVRPVGATPLRLDGHSGWMTSENGLVTVTQELADGTTRFFAGTAPPARVQTLALAAFAHSEEVLQPL